MDNIETNEPEGGQDVSSSQDTSTDNAQTTETEESVDDAQSEEVEQASLLAGKFKSPEELAKAYKELESKLGEQGQKAELANLIEQRTGMTHQQIKEMLAQQEQQRMEEAVRENPGLAAFQEVQSLKSQLALQAEEKELDSFLNSEEGKPYASFRDKILNLGLKLETGKTYDEIAREYFGNARAQGQQDAYKKIETKQMTQSSGVKSAPSSKITLEEMRNMSASQLAQILPHRTD